MQHHHEVNPEDPAKPESHADASESSHPSSNSPPETGRKAWDDEVARIATAFRDSVKRRADSPEKEPRLIDPREERHRQFVERAVAEPLRGIVDAFKRQGLAGSITILQDRVIGTVEGRSFAVHIEFQGDEPIAYHSYSPDPPRTIARGSVRGLSVEQLVDLVLRQFVAYLDETLRR